MVQMNLGLMPDKKLTAKKVKKFLVVDFQQYLDLAGMHRNQLTSPQLSLAPGSTNKNNIENNFIEDTQRDIDIADPARIVCAAVYRTMEDCTDTEDKPYKRILIDTYIKKLRVFEVAANTSLSTSSVDKKKIDAQVQFANRWLHWADFYGLEDYPDFRVMKKSGIN